MNESIERKGFHGLPPLIAEDSEVLQEFGRPVVEDARASEDGSWKQADDAGSKSASPNQVGAGGKQQQSSPSGVSASLALSPAGDELQSYIHQLEQQLRATQQDQQVVETLLNETQEQLRLRDRQITALSNRLAHAESDGPKARLMAAAAALSSSRHQVRTSSSSGMAHSSHTPLRPGSAGATAAAAAVLGPGLTGQDVLQLRKELQEQEQLIQGYQQENEAAMFRIKELEQALASTQASTAAEVARLERQRAMVMEQGKASGAEAAARLQRMLDLESHLQEVQDAAAARERELGHLVDQLRREKQEAEARAAGVDMAKIREEDTLVAEVRAQMSAMQVRHAASIAALQEKIKWYAENQQLLSANDSLVQQQAELIQQLRERLAAAEGPLGMSQKARIKELEQQVASLQETLTSRNPNSLAAVLATARPSQEQLEAVQQLELEKEALQQQLVRQQREHEHALRSLRQQYEQLKGQLEQRLAGVKQAEGSSKGKARIKELEQQLEAQRAMYTRHIRNLELKGGSSSGAQAAAAVAERRASRDSLPKGLGKVTPLAGAAAVSNAAAAAGGGRGHTDGQDGDVGEGDADGELDAVQAGQLQKKEEEVQALKSLLQERGQQYANLQQKYYSLEIQLRQLQKRLQQDQGPQQPARSQQQQQQLASPRQPGVAAAQRQKQPQQKQAALMKLRGKRSQARGLTSGQGKHGTGETTTAAAGGGGIGGSGAGDETQGKNVGSEGSDISGSSSSSDDDAGAQQEEWQAAGDGEAGAMWQQRCRTLQEANRQLRQQLLKVASGAVEGVGQDQLQLHHQAATASAAAGLPPVLPTAPDQQRVLLQLVEEAAYREQLRWQDRVQQLEQALRDAHTRTEDLEVELDVAKQSWTPQAHAFAALEAKIRRLQDDAASREQQWKALLEDKQQLAGAQVELLKKRFDVALETKNAEIEGFRVQVEALLAAARQLYQQRQQQQIQ